CTRRPLEFPSRKRRAVIFIRRACEGQTALHFGRSRRRLSHATARARGPKILPSHKPGSSSTLTALKRLRPRLSREDIECWSRTRKNRGARLSVASSGRKDCWWGSRIRRGCERIASAGCCRSSALQGSRRPDTRYECAEHCLGSQVP